MDGNTASISFSLNKLRRVEEDGVKDSLSVDSLEVFAEVAPVFLVRIEEDTGMVYHYAGDRTYKKNPEWAK